MRARDRRERHLLERDRAKLDQLRAEQIAALHLAQIARLHEAADETVRRAARRAERGADRAHVARAARDRLENREPAQQRLRARLLRGEIERRAGRADAVGERRVGMPGVSGRSAVAPFKASVMGVLFMVR